ncbi:histone-lysine n-methyltransferase set9 [Moniliophthora roreri]|nr:histone-lysine n-methyltransferase set9 [Moniliophthora roreri]
MLYDVLPMRQSHIVCSPLRPRKMKKDGRTDDMPVSNFISMSSLWSRSSKTQAQNCSYLNFLPIVSHDAGLFFLPDHHPRHYALCPIRPLPYPLVHERTDEKRDFEYIWVIGSQYPVTSPP